MHTGRSTVKKTINQPGPLFFFRHDDLGDLIRPWKLLLTPISRAGHVVFDRSLR